MSSKQDVIDKWKKDKRKRVPDSDKQMFCRGCRKNYYNGRGADQCWNLKGAKLKEREIYMSLHSHHPQKMVTLDCFIPQYH